ncbi:hypothetical protein QWI17_22675 [Gilvimarinus sp. SDUM040013]|uniref:Uncharacterized protein n=1 Tax=Gilvimarinus gilvus TaxID=3058038 RepID=A0ABU4S2U0_9GAMM|nr:hypothetical protein [Gilvimarinus sp. SDUM040013]MDO3388669.1 hypothetical protein [Gilvimarinus sp. SDUM040013]MDX6849564.1 hypothetical protein [Gilvimarinus sp. SDUM040013]
MKRLIMLSFLLLLVASARAETHWPKVAHELVQSVYPTSWVWSDTDWPSDRLRSIRHWGAQVVNQISFSHSDVTTQTSELRSVANGFLHYGALFSLILSVTVLIVGIQEVRRP